MRAMPTAAPSAHHLAQVNVGRTVAPLDSAELAGFMALLDPLNALADAAPGFVWRLQTDEGNATGIPVAQYAEAVKDAKALGLPASANGNVAQFTAFEDGQETAHKSWIADGTPFYNYVHRDGRRVGVQGGEFCKRTVAKRN